MATSRFSQNNPDYVDVAMVILAFEDMNKVCIEIRLSRVGSGEKRDIGVTAIAHPEAGAIGDLPPLASVSVTCSATHLKTLDSVVLACLYRLDHQLAFNEFAAADLKRA